MPHFSHDTLNFLRELSIHNERDWFSENRKRYETAVKAPFKAFVEEVIGACSEREPIFEGLESKHCIFRINRDTRFSKDKRPYKTHVSAGIAPGGKKSGDPGLYLHFDAEKLMIGGGAYWVPKDDLYVLREHIAAQPGQFNKLLEDAAFQRTYGTLLGERNVRIPKEFQAAAEVCPFILNKQFYYMAEMPASTILEEDILKTVMAHFDAASSVRHFLRTGLQAG